MEARSWSDLPDLPLHTISTFLPSLSSFSSFSRVCRSWLSVSSSAKPLFLSSHSPLVLCSASPSDDATANVYNLYSLHDRAFYTTHLRRTSTKCLGFTNGFLILMLDDNNRLPLLLNPLTSAELSFPTSHFPVDTAVLLSPTVHDSKLLLAVMSPHCAFQLCRPGDTAWSVCDARHWVWCAASHRGKVYALVDDWRLAVLNVDSPSVTLVDTEALPNVVLPQGSATLADAGGELVAVVLEMDEGEWERPAKVVVVYRFDFQGKAWVKTRSLNGGSLFLGHMLHSAWDGSPAAWGGEGDCVYLSNVWRSCKYMHRLRMGSGEVEDVSVAEEDGNPSWDYCVWVIPSLCF